MLTSHKTTLRILPPFPPNQTPAPTPTTTSTTLTATHTHAQETTNKQHPTAACKTNPFAARRLKKQQVQEEVEEMETFRDVSSCNTYNYGDAVYWDARYVQEAGSFDWYQRYSSLRPFVRLYVPTSSRILMVGCGNALMSEDMVKDGYEDIMNVDISSVAIEMMRRKYEYIPQLKYMQMDVRDMSVFPDECFDSVIDKGTLDSLMCGNDAPISSSQMLAEVSRLLKPGGIFMLITYGDPKVRMPHLSRPMYNWKILLYIIPRPGFERPAGSSSSKSYLEPVPMTEEGLLPADYVLEDPDSHFIYVCKKMDEAELIDPSYG